MVLDKRGLTNKERDESEWVLNFEDDKVTGGKCGVAGGAWWWFNWKITTVSVNEENCYIILVQRIIYVINLVQKWKVKFTLKKTNYNGKHTHRCQLPFHGVSERWLLTLICSLGFRIAFGSIWCLYMRIWRWDVYFCLHPSDSIAGCLTNFQ